MVSAYASRTGPAARACLQAARSVTGTKSTRTLRAGQVADEEVTRVPVELLGGDDPIAGPAQRHERRRDGGHATRRHDGRLSALEPGDGDGGGLHGGVAETGVPSGLQATGADGVGVGLSAGDFVQREGMVEAWEGVLAASVEAGA